MHTLFSPGDILLPRDTDLCRWAVIACDQFTSRPEYWERVEAYVGEHPSTLRLMLPEAYLGRTDIGRHISALAENMERYWSQGRFRSLPQSMICVERTLSGGGLRRGLLGLLDLEAYDPGSQAVTPIRPTEGLVEDRLPPRLALRQMATLESPHLVVFYDDPEFRALNCAQEHAGEVLYDFPLMEGGGRIRGRLLQGEGARAVQDCFRQMEDPEALKQRYGLLPPLLYAVGDGNHSLCTAKQCWESLRSRLSPRERETHPARYVLAELVNVREPSMDFEPIHRVLFDTDPRDFLREARAFFSPAGAEAHGLQCIAGTETLCLSTGGTVGESIARCHCFIEQYRREHGGEIDYIHGEADTRSLCARPGRAGILMPELPKNQLFDSIARSGAFPKKSFSIGPALDKRYYLECRRIVP